MRWQLAADDSPQRPLFEGLLEREAGRGEFRGMEFLHVEAKRIVNELPEASQVPFRHTINVYRGCSHACTYCLAGDTPVLMADGTTRPVAKLRAGDRVYGTEVRGAYRRYVVTEVLDHWSTGPRPAWRVTLEDGTELVASADHRFLTNRGWKHVAGAEVGPGRRPHLTTANKLMGTGRFAVTPPAGRDYRVGYLTGLIRGDAHPFRLVVDDDEAMARSRAFLASEGVDTEEIGHAVRALTTWPLGPSAEWRRGFLAGTFDAAGSAAEAVRFSVPDPVVMALVAGGLSALGFRYAVEGDRPAGPRHLRLLGGLAERLRFFHTVDPAVSARRALPEGTALKSDAKLQVVSVEPLGVEVPMYDLTTGTGDFVADGVVSHNCFARPTHEYLDLDTWEDFERRIVVKVNAVERLRAELHPRRWAGEHIAMGTNTDPYQRCEGKYRLTRGVVETLGEFANPFSILTKSTLVLRDLDVLAEAARRTDVSVNLSIGTLDEDVWKLTEPGTPHPRQRVEAVARLNEAGVRAGVMVAPIIPGLSDEPEQLDRVVGACVAAGARVISPIVLHLRPGVRELFWPWLEERRPDLLARYRRLYGGRSYSPRPYQREVARLVGEAVERHGGIRHPVRSPRNLPPRPEPPPVPEQIPLL